MLKEIHMPPGLLLGVMHLASLPTALRASEPRPLRKVDPQIQPALLSIKPNIHHPPRLLKTQRLLEQVDVVHTRLPSSRIKKPGSLPTAPDGYPLRTWRSQWMRKAVRAELQL